MMLIKTAVVIVIFALVVDWSAAAPHEKSELTKILNQVFRRVLVRDRLSGEEALQLLREAKDMPAVTEREIEYMPIINELVALCTQEDISICSNWNVFNDFRAHNHIKASMSANECIKLCEEIQKPYCAQNFQDKVSAELAKLSLEDLNQVTEFRDFMGQFGEFRVGHQSAKGLGKFILMKTNSVKISACDNEFSAEIDAHITPVCDKIRGVLHHLMDEYEYKRTHFEVPIASSWFELLKECSTLMENSNFSHLAHAYAYYPLKE